jgi:hypothetical protein
MTKSTLTYILKMLTVTFPMCQPNDDQKVMCFHCINVACQG